MTKMRRTFNIDPETHQDTEMSYLKTVEIHPGDLVLSKAEVEKVKELLGSPVEIPLVEMTSRQMLEFAAMNQQERMKEALRILSGGSGEL